MMDDFQKPGGRRPEGFWHKLLKGSLIAIGLLAVGAIVIVGLVLGACFLSSR